MKLSTSIVVTILLAGCLEHRDVDQDPVTTVDQTLFGWGSSCTCPSNNCPNNSTAQRCGANGIGAQPFVLVDSSNTCAAALHCEPRACPPNQWMFANGYTYDCTSPSTPEVLMAAPPYLVAVWPDWANAAWARAKWLCFYLGYNVLQCQAEVDEVCKAYAAAGTLAYKNCVESGYAACDLACT